METEQKWSRDDVMRRVRGLIDKANHPNTGDAERETFLRHADAMMTKWTIEAWEMEFAKPAGEREEPKFRNFKVQGVGDYDYEVACWRVLNSLVRLCRCRANDRWNPKVIGYESDLNYLEMLYTGALLHMTQHLYPKVEADRSWIANMAFLRWSGRSWQEIHFALSKDAADYPYIERPWGRGIGTRFTNEMRKYAQESGRIVNKAANTERWRTSFIEGFAYGVQATVDRLRQEQSTQGGLVLVGRQEAIDALYLDQNPEEKPHEENCDCDLCHRAKCTIRATCTRRICVEARKPIKLGRARKYEDKTDYAAVAEGRRRGEEINLARGAVPSNPKAVH